MADLKIPEDLAEPYSDALRYNCAWLKSLIERIAALEAELAAVAATIIQWLGSLVGLGFVDEVKRAYKQKRGSDGY